MVENGYIRLITPEEVAFDGDSNPVPAEDSFVSKLLPCHIVLMPDHQRYKQYEEGQFKVNTYSILVEAYLLRGIDVSTIKSVQLYEDNKIDKGVFQVQSAVKLSLTNKWAFTL